MVFLIFSFHFKYVTFYIGNVFIDMETKIKTTTPKIFYWIGFGLNSTLSILSLLYALYALITQYYHEMGGWGSVIFLSTTIVPVLVTAFASVILGMWSILQSKEQLKLIAYLLSPYLLYIISVGLMMNFYFA